MVNVRFLNEMMWVKFILSNAKFLCSYLVGVAAVLIWDDKTGLIHFVKHGYPRLKANFHFLEAHQFLMSQRH